jgi:hypothetical protein
MTTYPTGVTASGSAPPPYGADPPGEWWSPPTPLASPPITADVLRQQAAALLQHVYRWLEATAPTSPRVLDVVPTLLTAVQLYVAEEYLSCRNQVAAATEALRQARPALPPL